LIENTWAWLTLNRLREEGYFMKMSKQAVNQTNFNADLLKNTFISLPPLQVQKQIISQVEDEQKLVESNKKLIDIFEQKIKDKIAEVWGEELNKEPGQNASSNGTQKQVQPVLQAEAAQAELGLG
jgi:restriction endonuclease S subunit